MQSKARVEAGYNQKISRRRATSIATATAVDVDADASVVETSDPATTADNHGDNGGDDDDDGDDDDGGGKAALVEFGCIAGQRACKTDRDEVAKATVLRLLPKFPFAIRDVATIHDHPLTVHSPESNGNNARIPTRR
jgi:hypothetical protein